MALTKPFCENGDKTTIPETTPDGSVSYDQGFGASYALPPEEGGKFIDRAQFNQLMYDTTSAVIDNSDNITTLQGYVTAAKANITTLQQKTSNLEKNVSNLKTQASTGVGYLTQNINWNIGPGGDYQTIAAALTEANKYNSISNKKINLNLKNNYAGGEDLRNFSGDYSFVNINGNNIEFGFDTFFIKIANINIRIINMNIVNANETAIDIGYCPLIRIDNLKINAGAATPISILSSRVIVVGDSCNLTTTGNNVLIAQSSIVHIRTEATYSSIAQNFSLVLGSIVSSNSPATANIAKNTPTTNGLFLN